ncbi:hypothetical protein Q0T86_25060, partial [Escherichia coli O21:H21]|nr:hypothetical protein [Escherichia coli]
MRCLPHIGYTDVSGGSVITGKNPVSIFPDSHHIGGTPKKIVYTWVYTNKKRITKKPEVKPI